MTVLAFPPVGAWPLVALSIVPLIWAGARGPSRPWRALAWTTLGVLPARLFEERWLINVTAPGYPLMALYMATYMGVFVGMLALVRRAWPRAPLAAVVPVLWVVVEVFRGEIGFTGYPWFLIGHPIIAVPALAAPGAVLGAYFVSFLLATLVAAAIDGAARDRRRRLMGVVSAAGVVAVWALTGLAGWASAPVPPEGTPIVRVAAVQTNVPQSNKMQWSFQRKADDWRRFAQLTVDAADGKPAPALIAWPETMFPGDSLNSSALGAMRRAGLVFRASATGRGELPETVFADELLKFQAWLGIPMIVGAGSTEGLRAEDRHGKISLAWTARFNSAFLLRDGRVEEGRYDKLALTPFGEVIPYLWRWPSLQKLVLGIGAEGMEFDLSPGKEGRVFEVDAAGSGTVGGGGGIVKLRFITPICFEGTKGEVCRRLAYADGKPAAGLILNISNDGWFGTASGGREQHLLAARWRCVELGLPMVRAVNTGVSAWIDPHGGVLALGPYGAGSVVDVDGVLTASVPAWTPPTGTIYGRVGDVFPWSCLWAGVGLTGLAWWRGRRTVRGASVERAGAGGR